MKKLFGLCFAVALIGCSEQKQPVNVEQPQAKVEPAQAKKEDAIQFTEQLEIAPELKDFQPYELGELVKNLMPDAQQNQPLQVWQWEHLANDAKILWITDGYKQEENAYTSSTVSSREGLARVHQLGARVSELKDRKYELPWLIRFEGADARFGVTLITLRPNTDVMVGFDDPIPSLKKQGIKITTICDQRYAGEEVNVSLLEAPNKQSTYLIDRSSSGSRGESRWLELSLQNLSTEWCPDDSSEV